MGTMHNPYISYPPPSERRGSPPLSYAHFPMPRTTTAIFISFILLVSSLAHADQKVRIVVRVPADTPANESVYVAGSLPSVGSWKPDGVKLSRQPDGTFSADLDLPVTQTLEFKLTRGSWPTVEKNANGADRPNRRVAVDAATRQIDATVERWASDKPAALPSTGIGNLQLHTINSRALKQPRTIRVWLPPGYDANPNPRYSVLYMHDGQNCFDRATSAFGNEWEIDETLTRLIRDKRIPPLIVVAIDNGLANRINELTYVADAKHGGGQAAAYAEFLLTEVKPFIEKTYRIEAGPAHTFLGGSSLGGLVSLEIARRHPNIFGGVIAMSPAIWWSDDALLKEVEADPGGLVGARVWIDMGSRESVPDSSTGASNTQSQRFVDAARRLDVALTKHRTDHHLLIDDKHAEHNEPAWASRFPEAITYILNAK
jgi:predicted alpha/beta superfamily hydrolase